MTDHQWPVGSPASSPRASAMRLGTEHMQMQVMLAKVEKHIASLGLSTAVGLHEKAACLALCREIKALRQQVAR